MHRLLLILLSLLASVSACAGEVERLYVIDCGFAHAEDQSLWSPGVGVNFPIDFSDNCYPQQRGVFVVGYRHHRSARGASARADRSAAATDLVPQKPLVAALVAIGLKPTDVRYVAISHIHPDHIGNVDAFPDSTLIKQRREWEAAMASPQKPFHRTTSSSFWAPPCHGAQSRTQGAWWNRIPVAAWD